MKNKTVSDQVIFCLQEQLKCYGLLVEKMEEQEKVIALADERRLLAIMEENEVLIGSAGKLEEKIGSIFKGIPEAERNNIVKATAKLRGQIEACLKKLVALEKVCEEALNDEKSRIQAQIKELQQKKSVLGKYGKTGEGQSWFSKKA